VDQGSAIRRQNSYSTYRGGLRTARRIIAGRTALRHLEVLRRPIDFAQYRKVEVVPEMPLTPVGKPDTKALRAGF
jgi:non-ribosomal peptide synthetase component E (peptide arylation enzyme)